MNERTNINKGETTQMGESGTERMNLDKIYGQRIIIIYWKIHSHENAMQIIN